MIQANHQSLTANPVHIASGMRVIARKLTDNFDFSTAHPDRMRQAADEAEALLVDARYLVGDDQHDRQIWRRISRLRDHADLVASRSGE